MKWFKHFSKAHCDVRITRLIKKHGLKGYGLYFAIIEFIAFNLETEKPMPDLEENAKDIADFFGEDTIEIEQIITTCLEENLLEHDKKTGRINCLKLLIHLDNTMSANPEIKKILTNFKKLKETLSNSKQIRLDKTKPDKIRLDDNNKYIHILNLWNEQDIIKCNKITDKIHTLITKRIKEHSEKLIIQAINNYSEVYHSKYYFDYKWNFEKFLKQENGLPDFFNDVGEKWMNYAEWHNKEFAKEVRRKK